MSKLYLKKAGYIAMTILLCLSLLSLFNRVESEYVLKFNYIAMVILVTGLALLFFTEKKFGYFKWLLQKIRKQIDYFKELQKSGKKVVFILHLLSVVVTVLVTLMVGGLVMFGYFSKITILSVFFGTMLAVILQLVDRISSGRGAEPAKLFLTVTVLVGIMMCYTLPPALYVAWDDEAHFRHAYDLVHIFDDERSIALSNIFEYNGNSANPYTEDPESFVRSVLQGSSSFVEYQPRMSNPYTALGYLPMMLFLAVLSLLGADLIKILVLCRLANLLAYGCIVYFGIRKLKSGACIISAVCLLPCALFLACSFNYDFWLTAWFAYGFAYLISELQQPEKKFATADLVKILLAFFLACGPKAIYCIMLLPLLFLKNSKFESSIHAKKFRIWVVGIICFILATIIIPGFIVSDLYTDNRGGTDVSAGGQISFILSNPFRYAYILLKFLSEFCSFSQMNTYSAFYAYLGNAHVFFGTISAFILLYCIFTDRKADDAYETMQATRWTTLFVCFVQLVLIATSLYVGYTPIGLETINGCQYRYIFPLLIPFCFFLAPSKIKCNINPKFQSAFVYGALAFNIMMSFFNVYIGKF